MDPISAARAYGAPSSVSRLSSTRQAEDIGAASETESTQSTQGTFTDALSRALSDANTLQNKADHSIQQLATGEVQDIHHVMVAFEQAKLSMQTLVETRNKLVEAYQEVSRMPI